jgi:Tol biopolymer transport system component
VILDRFSGKEIEVPDSRGEYQATIAPDGSAIVFVSSRWGANHDLWILPLQNGLPSTTPQPLIQDEGTPSHPAFSPDGKWIAYYRIIGEERDIWIIPSAGGSPKRVTNHRAPDIHPSWSPDSKKLAFISEREGGSQIWIVSLHDSSVISYPEIIATRDLEAEAPAWSPDGKEIAFIGRKGGQSEVWVVPLDGSTSARQVTKGADARRVRWDPMTGKLMASGNWGEAITAMRLITVGNGETSDMEWPAIFGLKNDGALFDLSGDGRLLIYSKEDMTGDIWLFEAIDGIF